MLKFIDNFLNKITMYRIVLYVLFLFFITAFVLSVFKVLPYGPIDLIISLLIILFVCYVSNLIFSYTYQAPTNTESIYITALILFFIITPIQDGSYLQFLPLAFWVSVWAMASKYIFAIKRKHIFNPAAIALVIVAFTINQSASWWIGTTAMLPVVILGGFLIIRKLRRFDLFLSFSISGLVTISLLTLAKGTEISDVLNILLLTIKNSAFLFFAFIMLTEPLTSPTTKWLRIVFGIIVGFLFAPALHIGSLYSTPELALVIGNIFAYLVSPKEKLFLKLKGRVEAGANVYDLIFHKDKKFSFKPGQYMEWTLKHDHPDTRGNRRYFTLASSPTENEIHLGVKFYPKPSSFKTKLRALPIDSEIIASQTAGDFVLPKDPKKGLVFIAGGIGITPFRSMIKYLLDTNEKRDITLLYSNKKIEDISYKEIFDQAQNKLGIKTIYAITDTEEKPIDSSMYSGFISSDIIQKEVADYKNKTFYISGPHSMVDAFEKTLKSMGIKNKNIKIDFFPGFA